MSEDEVLEHARRAARATVHLLVVPPPTAEQINTLNAHLGRSERPATRERTAA